MSVNWQDSTSPARLKAYAAAHASGEFDHTVPTWDIYCDLREALIWALLAVKFPPRSPWEITESNWQEIYRRLQIMESVGGCSRRYNNGDGPTRNMWFTPQEIESMIGLRVNAGNASDAEFKKMIFKRLEESATSKLESWTEPSKETDADPYRWERRQMEGEFKRREREAEAQRYVDRVAEESTS